MTRIGHLALWLNAVIACNPGPHDPSAADSPHRAKSSKDSALLLDDQKHVGELLKTKDPDFEDSIPSSVEHAIKRSEELRGQRKYDDTSVTKQIDLIIRCSSRLSHGVRKIFADASGKIQDLTSEKSISVITNEIDTHNYNTKAPFMGIRDPQSKLLYVFYRTPNAVKYKVQDRKTGTFTKVAAQILVASPGIPVTSYSSSNTMLVHVKKKSGEIASFEFNGTNFVAAADSDLSDSFANFQIESGEMLQDRGIMTYNMTPTESYNATAFKKGLRAIVGNVMTLGMDWITDQTYKEQSYDTTFASTIEETACP